MAQTPAASGGTRPDALLTLPNIISFGRLCAVPLAIHLVLEQSWRGAFAVFLGAGVSDAVDGWLARRWGGTALGAMLDPLADKALMTGMYPTLAAMGQVPVWLAILVVLRDATIVGGLAVLRLSGHAVPIAPLAISRTNTALQMTLIAVLLAVNAFGLASGLLRLALIGTLIVLVALSTLASFAAYVIRTLRPA